MIELIVDFIFYLHSEDIMFRHFFRFTFLLLTLAVLFVACGEDDNPIVDNDKHDEPFHADADGFVLKVGGQEIYRQFQGTQTGGITLKAGDELDVLAVFLDPAIGEFFPENPEEGEEHDHDHDHEEEEGEEEFVLSIVGFDASIIDVHLHAGEEHEHEDHDDEEDNHDHEEDDHDDELADKFTFEVIGLSAGKTQLSFQLLHGDHPDFTAALPIPVTVTQ